MLEVNQNKIEAMSKKIRDVNLFDVVRSYVWRIVGLALLMIAGNALNLTIPKIVSGVINTYTSGSLAVNQIIFEFILVVAFILVFTYLQSIAQVHTAKKVTKDLGKKLMAKMSNNSYRLVFLLIMFIIFFYLTPVSVQAAIPLSGRILLQVNKNGQAWYVDPLHNRRAFLGHPANAFAVMRGFGLGVNNSDLAAIRQSLVKRQSLAGRILIQVENKGAAFYINPVDLALNYLGRPADALALMRTLALGISNNDLVKIPVDGRYPGILIAIPKTTFVPITSSFSSTTTTNLVTSTLTTSTPIVSNGQIIAANTCIAWIYTSWSPCTVYGNQTREIVTSFPPNCAGGNYVLEQSCQLNNGEINFTATSTIVTATVATATAFVQPLPSLDDLLLSAAFSDNGKNVGLSCKPWVNKLASVVTNGLLILPSLQSDNYTWGLGVASRVLYRSTAIENVKRADIIQYNAVSEQNLPHTAIVVTKTPTGMVWIHSNWRQTNTVSVDFITYAYFNFIAGSEYSVYHIY